MQAADPESDAKVEHNSPASNQGVGAKLWNMKLKTNIYIEPI